jgi:hypothetical protein
MSDWGTLASQPMFDFILVGGGGAGGNGGSSSGQAGGGGGAGGLAIVRNLPVINNTTAFITITVGAGGTVNATYGNQGTAQNGTPSSIAFPVLYYPTTASKSFVANGGGAGGAGGQAGFSPTAVSGWSYIVSAGTNAGTSVILGCGGGGGCGATSTGGTPAGTYLQFPVNGEFGQIQSLSGNAGNNGANSSTTTSAGGGGGSRYFGTLGSTTVGQGSQGGSGFVCEWIPSTAIALAVGGGGGRPSAVPGDSGNLFGYATGQNGARGAYYGPGSVVVPATSPVANTGSGGGGGIFNITTATAGASGRVIIRFRS